MRIKGNVLKNCCRVTITITSNGSVLQLMTKSGVRKVLNLVKKKLNLVLLISSDIHANMCNLNIYD